ncbi:MAG: type II toxin-antitoxin system PemK/MazF family toxin [Flavobacteriaceae bacterium]
MAKSVTVVVNQDADEEVAKKLASVLRRDDALSRQLRNFAEAVDRDQIPNGLQFQPKPGQLLICHFGVGFQVPENVKTRPVLVISPHQRQWTGLCVVVPISSQIPKVVRPYHYKLPKGTVPSEKYEESWIKGDMVIAVGKHRLDRIKVAPRHYVSPIVPDAVLREARRCVLHASGMHSLTIHW